jgi:hypothetical protein
MSYVMLRLEHGRPGLACGLVRPCADTTSVTLFASARMVDWQDS